MIVQALSCDDRRSMHGNRSEIMGGRGSFRNNGRGFVQKYDACLLLEIVFTICLGVTQCYFPLLYKRKQKNPRTFTILTIKNF